MKRGSWFFIFLLAFIFCSSFSSAFVVEGDCNPSWSCQWSACSNGITYASNCVDDNNCGLITGMPSSQACTSTTCSDECTFNAKQCSPNGLIQTCGQFDTDTCTEWGTGVACPTGQSCTLLNEVSACTTTTATCNPVCPVGSTCLNGNCILPLTVTNPFPSGAVQTTSVTISVMTSKEATCQYITTVNGQTVRTGMTASGNSHSASLAGLTSGVKSYLVECSSGTGAMAEKVTTTVTFTVSPPSCISNCNLPNWSTISCVNNVKTRTCTDSSGCTQTETQGCLPATSPTCQWTYQSSSEAFCFSSAGKRAIANPTNVPCTGSPDPTQCSGSTWVLNAHDATYSYGTIQGWSCDLGACVNTVNYCGWTPCHPAVGTTDPNCKTPDGTVITNDPSKCYCSNNGGCFGTSGEWSNYACSLFEPTRKLRIDIGSGSLDAIMIGLSNSCQEIRREATLSIYNVLMSSSWQSAYNFVSSLGSVQKSSVLQAVLGGCQINYGNSATSICTPRLTDIGLLGNGNSDSPSWKAMRINQILYLCPDTGYPFRVEGSGSIIMISTGANLGNAFDPALNLTGLCMRVRGIISSGGECTPSNAVTTCGSGKVCSNNLCCTPTQQNSTTGNCPAYFMWPLVCDSSGQQTKTCGDCGSIKIDKQQCPTGSNIRISTYPSGDLRIGVSDAEIRASVNRIASCRYSTSSNASFDTMSGFSIDMSTQYQTLFGARVQPRVGQNKYYVKCKLGDGPDKDQIVSGTISFTNPQTNLASVCPCNGNLNRICSWQDQNGITATGCVNTGTGTNLTNNSPRIPSTLNPSTMTVILNVPRDASTTGRTTTIAWTLRDTQYPISSTTLFVDGKVNYTNTSGFNGSYSITQRYALGWHNWSIGVVNSIGMVINSTNRTFSVRDSITSSTSSSNLNNTNNTASTSGRRTLSQIVGIPTSSSGAESCDGCFAARKCYPLGFRTNSQYCSSNKNFVSLVSPEGSCSDNFECKNNVCLNGQCVSQSTWQRIIEFLRNIFR